MFLQFKKKTLKFSNYLVVAKRKINNEVIN